MFGTLTNTSADTVFLNGDSENLAASVAVGSSVDDTPFFLNAPAFLGIGQSTGSIELFTLDIAPSAAIGPVDAGLFSVFGGIGTANSANFDLLGSQHVTFNVVPASTGVPEPGTLAYIGILLVATAAGRRRFQSRA